VDQSTDYNYNAAQVRVAFARLASALVSEGESEKAVKVLDYAMEQIPTSQFRWALQNLSIIKAYYDAESYEKGDRLLEDYFATVGQYMEHYLSFPESKLDLVVYEMEDRIKIMNELHRVAKEAGRTSLADSIAMKALEYGLEVYRKDNYAFPFFYPYVTYISAYYEKGDTAKGGEMLDAYTTIFMTEIAYLDDIRRTEPEIAERYIRENTIVMGELLRIAELYGQTDIAAEIKAFFGIE
jgi:tetratricopeptide (TPR) repeat protein